MDFGEGKKSIYALEGADILIQREKEVQLAAHDYGEGRGVYISGLPYSFINSRVLYRAILWSAHSEEELHTWFSSRRSCTPGSAQTATWRCTPTSKTASTVW